MIDATMGRESSWLTWGERDWWPLTRLLTVGLAFGFLAHWRFGWNPVVRDLWSIPGGFLTIFSFILLLSSTMAHLCLVVLSIPMCGIILCNDWFYDATHWTLRIVLRLRSRALLAVLGLCGEIALFGLASYLLKVHLLSHL
jgi:hypothetical protein